MTLRYWLFLFGLACVAAPLLIALVDGWRPDLDDENDDSNFIHWLAGKPLDQLFSMQGVVHFGFLLITVALVFPVGGPNG